MSLLVLIGANLILFSLVVTGQANSKCNYEPGTRIVGGEHAAEGEFPFIVRVIDSITTCGGTIIDERHILTAAHCLSSPYTARKSVFVGCHNRYKCSARHRIESFIKHPNFHKLRGVFKNDIALLRTRRPIQFVPGNELGSVGKIELATSLNDDLRDRFLVAGWGDQIYNETNRDPILRKVTVPNIPVDICALSYRGADWSLICAGENGKDACQGDSGGPLFFKAADRSYVQVGIVSTGTECGSKFGGVYTRVAAFQQWIRDSIQILSDQSRLEASLETDARKSGCR